MILTKYRVSVRECQGMSKVKFDATFVRFLAICCVNEFAFKMNLIFNLKFATHKLYYVNYLTKNISESVSLCSEHSPLQ